ncbi:MAG TPA: SUMF1/EgtB/PvdO family nonheme iron enzyme [Sedimentisphaerales bacterium]|nr:SUMF1/EgtB/PvdO family nonheme iron enzyme [Sedimentisphaerales bacterium]
MYRRFVFFVCAVSLLAVAAGVSAQCTVAQGEIITVFGAETCGTMYVAGTLIVDSTGSITGGYGSTLNGPSARIFVNGGSFRINGRFNVGQTSDGYIFLNGGTFTVTGTFKFPDDAGGVHRIYLNNGIMHSNDIELRGDRDAIIYVGGGKLRLNVVGSNYYDPFVWMAQGWLQPAQGYEGLVIEYVPAGGYTEIRSYKSDPNVASNPEPADMGSVFEAEAALGWTPGLNAVQHDVYLGTSLSDVNDAADPDVAPGRGRHDSNTYDVSGLEFYKTYYWRIDEVNGPMTWKGEVWRFTPIEAYTNSLGMFFLKIPEGTFTMGEGDSFRIQDEGSVDYDEQPAHTVTISKPFYVLQTKVADAYYQQSGLSGSAADVSWDNAAAFCQWLSNLEGKTYRLPTEAQWEYVFDNPWGVRDMGTREWVQDWHGTYPHDPVTDPTGPVNGVLKVIRGVNGRDRWALPANATYAPWKLGEAKACGFRVVLEQEPSETGYVSPGPFCQAGIKQSTSPAQRGPDPDIPYFTVRFSMPIPPDNISEGVASMLGCCASTMHHNHSPGFEIMPNGDALAVWFSANTDEYGSDTRFVQARLRYGSDQWDMPELFWDMKGMNDESGLLWTEEDGPAHFFGGGRIANSNRRPFVMATSTDSGATWNLKRPDFPVPAVDYQAQPVVNAWRQNSSTIYTVTDAENPSGTSMVWRSTDNGLTWHDMGGRTNGRHSTIVPVGSSGRLLSYGGKNTDIDGWMPWNESPDWGATWPTEGPTVFAPLGSNQRPCMIRLENGKLALCTDAQHRDNYKPPGSTYDYGCLVAISSNNGDSWYIRNLPATLPHESDRDYGTLGYSTIRQAPSGVLHILTTMTHPCLHYELNEDWIYSSAGDIPPETSGGTVEQYSENYPGGALKATWNARTCTNGRYLLHGTETSYYQDGTKEHEVTYVNGRKTGTETFWTPDGTKLWSWRHDDVNNVSVWTHWWSNKFKRIESRWNSYPAARDLPTRHFSGFVAHGYTYQWDRSGMPVAAWNFINGQLAGSSPLPPPQRLYAWNPSPADGAWDVAQGTLLAWSSGDYAVSHDVYFGTNLGAVSNADHSSSEFKGTHNLDANSYNPPGFLWESATAYYWRIDEVAESETWKGDVWRFTTEIEEYALVDDMESYDFSTNRIGLTWIDGARNNTGSIVMLGTAPEPVHGGLKSMLFCYGWCGGLFECYSQIERSYSSSPRDWASLGVKALTLYFYGGPDNDANATEQMYVGLEDARGGGSCTQVKYGDHGEDMNDVKVAEWQEWNIDLQDFIDGGVDLTDVNKICIGFGDKANTMPGGFGFVYFDDIRLYLPRCVPSRAKPAGDLTDDCRVDEADLDIMTGQWLTSGIKADLTGDGDVNFKDYAVLAGTWLDSELWPPE